MSSLHSRLNRQRHLFPLEKWGTSQDLTSLSWSVSTHGLQWVSALSCELNAKGQRKLTACRGSANLPKFSVPADSHLQLACNLSYKFNTSLHQVCPLMQQVMNSAPRVLLTGQYKQELPVKEETLLSRLPTVDLHMKGWGFRLEGEHLDH